MNLAIAFLLSIAGFFFLWKGADWLVEGAASIALAAKVSTIVVGITVVAFGTSLPEMAVSLAHLGERQRAIEHFRAAGERGAQFEARSHRYLAQLCYDLGRFDEAEEELYRALGVGEDSAPIHLLAARILRAEGRHREAALHQAKAIERGADEPRHTFALGELWYAAGEFQAAEQALYNPPKVSQAPTQERSGKKPPGGRPMKTRTPMIFYSRRWPWRLSESKELIEQEEDPYI